MLGLSLHTLALTRECVHTKDTKWKESAFYANKLPCKGVAHFELGFGLLWLIFIFDSSLPIMVLNTPVPVEQR